MALKRCRKCGIPSRLSKGYIWPGNGTIAAAHDPTMRMVIFEAGYYPHVWKELEERLHVPIADVMIRGQQAATWDYLENNITFGWRKYALRLLPVIPIMNRIISDMSVFGFGKIEVVEYRRGRLLVLRIQNPHDIISIIWGVKGIFEFAEGHEAELAWNEEDGSYIVSAVLLPGPGGIENVDPEALEALREAKRKLSLQGLTLPHPGGEQERCPACGLPATLGELEWVTDEGIIRRRETGSRLIFSTGHIFVGVVSDLERRTGQELEPMIQDITKYFYLSLLKDKPAAERGDAYGGMARELFTYGFGEVLDLSHGEGHLEMTVARHFYIPRLLGRVAACFEHVEEQESEIACTSPEPGILRIEVTTA